jgi:hypothetical protein
MFFSKWFEKKIDQVLANRMRLLTETTEAAADRIQEAGYKKLVERLGTLLSEDKSVRRLVEYIDPKVVADEINVDLDDLADRINLDYTLLAERIDTDELLPRVELNYSDLARAVDMSDVAAEFSLSDIAREFDQDDLIDEIVPKLDLDKIAELAASNDNLAPKIAKAASTLDFVVAVANAIETTQIVENLDYKKLALALLKKISAAEEREAKT